MNFETYKKFIGDMSSENNYLRTLVVGQTIALILAFIFLGGKETIITQQPNNLTNEISVSSNSANQPYKERWALSFAELIGNLTPANLDFVKSGIEGYFSPELFQQVKVGLEEQSELLKHEQATVTFTPKSIIYEPSTDKVYINGDQEVRTFGVEPKRKNWSMEFGIKIVNYLPVVTWFDAYSGPPRTSEVREIEKKNQRNGASQ